MVVIGGGRGDPATSAPSATPRVPLTVRPCEGRERRGQHAAGERGCGRVDPAAGEVDDNQRRERAATTAEIEREREASGGSGRWRKESGRRERRASVDGRKRWRWRRQLGRARREVAVAATAAAADDEEGGDNNGSEERKRHDEERRGRDAGGCSEGICWACGRGTGRIFLLGATLGQDIRCGLEYHHQVTR